MDYYYAAEKLKSAGVEVPEELWPHIEGYISRREEDAKQMWDFLSREDYYAIDRLAHKVRGTGSSYGFDRITEYAGEIQNALRENDRNKLEDYVRNLGDEIKKVKSIIDMH